MNIPTGLPPQFVNYLLVPKADGADKIPCDPVGRAIDHLDPKNWMTYEAAAATGRPVAFALTDDCGWFFLDMDKCGDGNGWSPAATALFTRFTGAWGEVSSSGRGLHVMGRCNPAMLADRKRRWDGWLECYTGGRFIAFGNTGWARIGGHEVDYDWTSVLLEIVPQKAVMGDLPQGVDPAYTGPENDDELLARAMLSGGAGASFGLKASFKDLWTADVTVLSRIYPHPNGGFDRSSADAALMAHLAFWTGKDMPRMDRLFRRSALMRDKYATRPDYRDETIGNSVRLCTKVYDKPKAAAAPAGGGGPHEAYLTLAEMQEHFRGCVYIRDVHRVMIPGGKMLKPEQFNATYGGHQFQMQADGTKPSTKAFEAFTENRAMVFPKVSRPVFDPRRAPGEIIGDTVNIYSPPEIEMTPGDVSPLLDLLGKLLPDARDRAILVNYMAACVQFPGVKFQWAPVLQGCEGNGKTLVFSCIRYAVGKELTHSPKADQLGNQFNGYLEGKLFCLVEEVHMRGRGEMLDVLKPLITNEEIEVEAKGVDKRMIQNYANWAFCTNFQDAILKSRGDRRYAVFFTAQQRVEDLVRDGMVGEYFPRLWSWLKTGGYAAVAYWLKHWQIDPALNPAGLCHRAPQTSSTEAAILAATGSVEKEIMEACEDNTRGFRGGWISAWALDNLIRDRHLKISRYRQSEIVRELGFVEWGRAPRPLIEEGGKRPMLYLKAGMTGTFENFLTAQSYM